MREEERDGIGQCADYLPHREGIETVVVYGIIGNSYIDGSLRTKSYTSDLDKWLKDVFGKMKRESGMVAAVRTKAVFKYPSAYSRAVVTNVMDFD